MSAARKVPKSPAKALRPVLSTPLSGSKRGRARSSPTAEDVDLDALRLTSPGRPTPLASPSKRSRMATPSPRKPGRPPNSARKLFDEESLAKLKKKATPCVSRSRSKSASRTGAASTDEEEASSEQSHSDSRSSPPAHSDYKDGAVVVLSWSEDEDITDTPTQAAAVQQQQLQRHAAADDDEVDMRMHDERQEEQHGQQAHAQEDEEQEEEEEEEEQPKPAPRKRGRPRKVVQPESEQEDEAEQELQLPAASKHNNNSDGEEAMPSDAHSDEDDEKEEEQVKAKPSRTRARSATSNSPAAQSRSTSRVAAISSKPSAAPAASIPAASAASIPRERAAASSLTASPAKKAAKAWVAPISGAGTANTMLTASRAPSYDIKALAVSNPTTAMNSGGRVTHTRTIAKNMKTDELMLLLAYGPEAIRMQDSLKPGRCYTVQLESVQVADDRPTAVEGLKHTHRIGKGTTARHYQAPAEGHGVDLEVAFAEKTIQDVCMPIHNIAHLDMHRRSAPGDEWDEHAHALNNVRAKAAHRVNICGVVMEVRATPTRASPQSTKVVVADETGYIKVMFFELTTPVKVGDSLLIVGANLWVHADTGSREITVWGYTFVATNSDALTLSSKLKKRAAEQRYDGLANVSRPPLADVESMLDVMERARKSEEGSADVVATVRLHLDPERPSSAGPFWYNACNKCMKKMEPTGQHDDEGDALYAHVVDRQHEDTTYTETFLFTGCFKDPTDPKSVYRVQVNNLLATALFGCTAEEVLALPLDQQTSLFTTKLLRPVVYKVWVSRSQEITKIILIE